VPALSSAGSLCPEILRSWWVFLGVLSLCSGALVVSDVAWANSNGLVGEAEKLLRASQDQAEKTYYIEALDTLDEAVDMIRAAGTTDGAVYGDALYAMTQVKIKGRLHQNFPALYVKTALKDVQASNKLRERQRNILPRKLAEGYYLEGYIQKKFFKREREAGSCFKKAVAADPGFAAAKRELSELIGSDDEN
jgi:hypothetical protein